MDTCIAIIMYCQRLFLLFTGKQHCLQTNKYDQFRGVTEIYNPTKFWDLIWFHFQDVLNLRQKKKKKMNAIPHHSAIHL